MATDYTINDRNGETRIEGTIAPDPAFNGGTITAGVTIDPAVATSPVLLVQGAVGQAANATLFEVDDDDFNTDGVFSVRRSGQTQIFESIAGNTSSVLFQVTSFESLRAGAVLEAGPQEDSTALTVQGDGGVSIHGAGSGAVGLILRGPHAAPADGTLGAGDLALWFDQTNGASKLMIKAKQADGTVKTAAIALS